MFFYEEQADIFLQQMLEESANVVDTFRDPTNSPNFWSGAIPDITATEMSYLFAGEDELDAGDVPQTVGNGEVNGATTQQSQENGDESAGEGGFYGNQGEKKLDGDDNSDVENLTENLAHFELLKAYRRKNRFRNYNSADEIGKATSAMANFKDGEWASHKNDKDEMISSLLEENFTLESQLKKLQRAEGVVSVSHQAALTPSVIIPAEKAMKLVGLLKQIEDKKMEVQYLDATLTSKTEAQVDTTAQAWPTRIKDLPQGDAILIEFQNLISTVSGNYHKLKGEANNLELILNTATDLNSQLQTDIGQLKSLVKSTNEQLDSKSRLIEDLRKQLRKRTDSGKVIVETLAFKYSVEKDLAAKHMLLETATVELATANDKLCVLEQEKKRALRKASKASGAADFERKHSADKIAALEKELQQPRIDRNMNDQATEILDDLDSVKEENKKLRRTNFRVVQDANKEIAKLRENNLYLVLKMNDPKRKIAFREAYIKLQNMPEPVEKLLAAPIEKKEKEEKQRVVRAPESWTGDDAVVVYGASLTDTIADISRSIMAITSRVMVTTNNIMATISDLMVATSSKVAAIPSAALHVKFTAKCLWNQSKLYIFWLFMAFLVLISLAGNGFLDQAPKIPSPATCCKPKQRNSSGEFVTSAPGMRIGITSTTSNDSASSTLTSETTIGVLLLITGTFFVYNYSMRSTPMAEDQKFIAGELALRAAVRADILAQEDRKAAHAEAIRRQWQEAAARQPDFFESLHSGWIPVYQRPRKYRGNNL